MEDGIKWEEKELIPFGNLSEDLQRKLISLYNFLIPLGCEKEVNYKSLFLKLEKKEYVKKLIEAGWIQAYSRDGRKNLSMSYFKLNRDGIRQLEKFNQTKNIL